MHGFGSGVLELVDDFDGDTYRAVYAVRFQSAVYVLHAFQKKARLRVKTTQRDLDLIRARLTRAAAAETRLQPAEESD